MVRRAKLPLGLRPETARITTTVRHRSSHVQAALRGDALAHELQCQRQFNQQQRTQKEHAENKS